MDCNIENTDKHGTTESNTKDTKKQGLIESVINWIIDHDSQKIKRYVDKLREQNKGISDEELAQKIVNREAIMCGLA